jgi:hypothetical protein
VPKAAHHRPHGAERSKEGTIPETDFRAKPCNRFSNSLGENFSKVAASGVERIAVRGYGINDNSASTKSMCGLISSR